MTRNKAILTLGFFIGVIGGGYHPDTPMTDYVCGDKPSFSPEQAAVYQEMHDSMFLVLGDEAYSLALESLI